MRPAAIIASAPTIAAPVRSTLKPGSWPKPIAT